MRKAKSISVLAVILGAVLLIPAAAFAQKDTTQFDVRPDGDDAYIDGQCPEFGDLGIDGYPYQGSYLLSAGNEDIGYADVCHIVTGESGAERFETLVGRWHITNTADYVETVMDGIFVDRRNGPSQGSFEGEVLGGSGAYVTSTGTIKGHGTFNWQPTSHAWMQLHFVLQLG